MNARIPASADVLTRILTRASERFAAANCVEAVRFAEAFACGRLSMAFELGAISYDDHTVGFRTIETKSADRIRTLRAQEREAARRAA